ETKCNITVTDAEDRIIDVFNGTYAPIMIPGPLGAVSFTPVSTLTGKTTTYNVSMVTRLALKEEDTIRIQFAESTLYEDPVTIEMYGDHSGAEFYPCNVIPPFVNCTIKSVTDAFKLH